MKFERSWKYTECILKPHTYFQCKYFGSCNSCVWWWNFLTTWDWYVSVSPYHHCISEENNYTYWINEKSGNKYHIICNILPGRCLYTLHTDSSSLFTSYSTIWWYITNAVEKASLNKPNTIMPSMTKFKLSIQYYVIRSLWSVILARMTPFLNIYVGWRGGNTPHLFGIYLVWLS